MSSENTLKERSKRLVTSIVLKAYTRVPNLLSSVSLFICGVFHCEIKLTSEVSDRRMVEPPLNRPSQLPLLFSLKVIPLEVGTVIWEENEQVAGDAKLIQLFRHKF